MGYTVTTERVRGFQPPWYNVRVYYCDCGKITRLKVNWHGPAPRGAIICKGCSELLGIV